MKNTIKAIILATAFLSLSQFALAAPPANDNWLAAQDMMGNAGGQVGTNIDASAQPCEPAHQFPDLSANNVAPTASVWYKWFAPLNQSYTVRVNSILQYHTISVYVMVPGLCNGVMSTVPLPIAENASYSMTGASGKDSQVTFRATAGTTYYFSVDSLPNVARDNFTLIYGKAKYRYSASFDTRDAGSDLVIARPTANGREWWFARSGQQLGFTRTNAGLFGRMTDKRIMGDYDGDGRSDIVAARPENGNLTWWIADHNGKVIKVLTFGLATDKPIAGDYDNDAITDVAVTRAEANGQKTWHILRSSDGGYFGLQFGLSTDREIVGDFDGDGRTDFGVMRRNADNTYTWYIQRSASGQMLIRTFGNVGDVPQPADLNGDRITDLVIFRSDAALGVGTAGTWKWIDGGLSAETNPIQTEVFGIQGDYPQAGDYDGDGKDDLAIFRNGTWWMKRSTWGVVGINFGVGGDLSATDLCVTGQFFNVQ